MDTDSPDGALEALAARLRADGTIAADALTEPSERPVLGPLAAAGPRASNDPAAYSFVIEAVREGYLLHHGTPRLLTQADPDLALLAGDYLYALGISRLADLADPAAVVELSDLISIGAQAHTEGRPEVAEALWLVTAIAVGCGSTDGIRAAKEAARGAHDDAETLLRAAAGETAVTHGLSGPLAEAAKSIRSFVPHRQG
jgi:hypothetical protein